MSNKNEEFKNPYTQEDIRKMSYWQLWGLRRKAGKFYFIFLTSIYFFMTYLFGRVIYMFAKKSFDKFTINWWSIPLCLAVGIAYWFIHEWYYNNIYIKKNPDKVIKDGN